MYGDIFWAVVAAAAASGSWIYPIWWMPSLDAAEQSEWPCAFPALSHSFLASVR